MKKDWKDWKKLFKIVLYIIVMTIILCLTAPLMWGRGDFRCAIWCVFLMTGVLGLVKVVFDIPLNYFINIRKNSNKQS